MAEIITPDEMDATKARLIANMAEIVEKGSTLNSRVNSLISGGGYSTPTASAALQTSIDKLVKNLGVITEKSDGLSVSLGQAAQAYREWDTKQKVAQGG